MLFEELCNLAVNFSISIRSYEILFNPVGEFLDNVCSMISRVQQENRCVIADVSDGSSNTLIHRLHAKIFVIFRAS